MILRLGMTEAYTALECVVYKALVGSVKAAWRAAELKGSDEDDEKLGRIDLRRGEHFDIF